MISRASWNPANKTDSNKILCLICEDDEFVLSSSLLFKVGEIHFRVVFQKSKNKTNHVKPLKHQYKKSIQN